MDVNSIKSSPSSSFIPPGQRSSPRLREQQFMFQVLDNPSLREEILRRVIFGGNKKVDQRAAGILRLVQKSWDQSVLRILWQVHEPFYKLVAVTGSSMDTSIKRFSVSSRIISGPPPPLKLEGYCHLFNPTDFQILSNFMTACGPALLQMTCVIHELGIPMGTTSPQWSLSRLHKLEVGLKMRRGTVLPVASGDLGGGGPHEKKSDCLLNYIFRSATAMAELELYINKWSFGGAMAPDLTIFDSVNLPPTLVKIKADLLEKGSDAFLRALVRSPLPKLSSLSLSAGNAIISNGLLFSIMDRFKNSLNVLEIIGGKYEGPNRNVNLIRFPMMQWLEELSITSITAELEPGQDSLERCFPKLRTLRLRQQTPEMLRKWTESSRFTGVTNLELLLADEHVSGNDVDEFFMSTSMEAMQSVSMAFPNLRRLELGISKSDPSGLWYVFQEMRQLVDLKLKVFGNTSRTRTTKVWDSVLSGVPAEVMARFHRNKNPASAEIGQSLVSITNLQELKSLSVMDIRSYPARFTEGHSNRRSVISDFIFEHAFLKMPNLTHLHFEGPFKVSDGMADKWTRQEGRSLFYQRFVNCRLGS